MTLYIKEITFRGRRPDQMDEASGWHVVVGEYLTLEDGSLADLRDRFLTMDQARERWGDLEKMIDGVAASAMTKMADLKAEKESLLAELDGLRAEKTREIAMTETVVEGEEQKLMLGLMSAMASPKKPGLAYWFSLG